MTLLAALLAPALAAASLVTQANQGPAWPPFRETYLNQAKAAGVRNLWQLDDTSGTKAVDSIGNFTCWYRGTYTQSQTPLVKDGGFSVTLSGTNSDVSATMYYWAVSGSASPWTVEMWWKISNTAEANMIVFPLPNDMGTCRIETGNLQWSTNCGGGWTSITAITPNTTHYTTITRDGSTTWFYLDGECVYTCIADAGPFHGLDNFGGLIFGTYVTRMVGTIDNLSASDICMDPLTVRRRYARGIIGP